MPEQSTIEIDYLRTWIGREEIRDDTLTPDLARKFHATLGFPGPVPEPGQPAPPLIHFCLAQPAVPTSMLGDDGHPGKGEFLPPVPLPRRMWAGGEIAFLTPILVSQDVRRISRVTDVNAKSGRSGYLVFVTVEHRLESRSRLLLRERQDIVYREEPRDAPGPSTANRADLGEEQFPAEISAQLLFRYSALTFNSHRIHYDREYATGTEGYPDIVVHGPLQATLLCAFAAQLRGQSPTTFEFRAQSPLFFGDDVMLHARADGASLKLWTARANGPVAMAATAGWL